MPFRTLAHRAPGSPRCPPTSAAFGAQRRRRRRFSACSFAFCFSKAPLRRTSHNPIDSVMPHSAIVAVSARMTPLPPPPPLRSHCGTAPPSSAVRTNGARATQPRRSRQHRAVSHTAARRARHGRRAASRRRVCVASVRRRFASRPRLARPRAPRRGHAPATCFLSAATVVVASTGRPSSVRPLMCGGAAACSRVSPGGSTSVPTISFTFTSMGAIWRACDSGLLNGGQGGGALFVPHFRPDQQIPLSPSPERDSRFPSPDPPECSFECRVDQAFGRR